MIYWVYQFALAQGWLDSPPGSLLNVFQYQSFRAGVACVVAYLVAVASGERVIRRLIALKLGQPIRSAAEVHRLNELHGGKAGTPTMGGVLIIAGVAVATLVAARWDNLFVWVTLFVFLALGFLGFAVNNLFLYMDAVVYPHLDLMTLRTIPALFGTSVLLYGLITETV